MQDFIEEKGFLLKQNLAFPSMFILLLYLLQQVITMVDNRDRQRTERPKQGN